MPTEPKNRDMILQNTSTYICASCFLPASSWWMRSAKFGSSPHQNSQSSRRPCRWLRRQTHSTSAFRQRLKLHRMGSSSVTGNSIGAEVGPCHTNLFHLIPVRSACNTEERRWERINRVQRCCFRIHSVPSREPANHDGRAEKFWDETKLSNKLKQIFILQITTTCSPQVGNGAYVVSLT